MEDLKGCCLNVGAGECVLELKQLYITEHYEFSPSFITNCADSRESALNHTRGRVTRPWVVVAQV